MMKKILLSLMLFGLGLPASAQAVRPVVGEDTVHTVTEGDNLYTLSHDASLGLDLVALANHLPMKLELTPGQRVLIPGRRILPANPPRDGLVLNLPERGMYYFKHGQFVKFYPVAIGRTDFKTPRGNFRIILKTKDPTWVPPAWAGLGNISMGPGPKNPLGDRWMGLSAANGKVGIHGTQSPYSIGMVISHGCLRMYPDAVRELYDRVSVGTPVRIEYETVKVGRDPATGKLLMACFPDIYNLADPLREGQRLARQIGFQLTPGLKSMLQQERGLALDTANPTLTLLDKTPVEAAQPTEAAQPQPAASEPAQPSASEPAEPAEPAAVPANPVDPAGGASR